MTTPTFLKVVNSPGASIDIRHEITTEFKNPWHFHPELELTLILEGVGTHFIGNRIDNFQKNELTLTGPNLPHYWRCDSNIYKKGSKMKAEAVIIRFQENFLGDSFFSLPEMYHVKNLIELSSRGLKITGKTKEQAVKKVKRMMQMDGAERIITLLQILSALAKSSDYEILSSRGFALNYRTADIERINNVFDYLIKNFMQPIPLKTIASIANMNPSAFSRYFKTKTGKTFTEILHEIRIGHACKILIEENSSVSSTCYACGYEDHSYFIKQFKRITNQTPLQYQNQHSRGL